MNSDKEAGKKMKAGNKGQFLKAVFIAFLVAVTGSIIIFINDSAVLNKKLTLSLSAAYVTPIDPDKVENENNGRLVYITGKVYSPELLNDDDFGITVDAIHLKRIVEIYQWDQKITEKKEKLENGKEVDKKVYEYKKIWKNSLISSEHFNDPVNHHNPKKVNYTSKWIIAGVVKVGVFSLDDVFVNKIPKEEQLTLDKIVPKQDSSNVTLKNNQIYIGKGTPGSPEIGDIRIYYNIVRPQEVSIIGKQKNNKIVTFEISGKRKINLIEPGIVSSDKMFKIEIESGMIKNWLVRIAGFILLLIGFAMLYSSMNKRFSNLKIFNIGNFKFSFLLSLIILSVIISMVWILYVTITGIVFISVAVLSVILLFTAKPKSQQ